MTERTGTAFRHLFFRDFCILLPEMFGFTNFSDFLNRFIECNIAYTVKQWRTKAGAGGGGASRTCDTLSGGDTRKGETRKIAYFIYFTHCLVLSDFRIR